MIGQPMMVLDKEGAGAGGGSAGGAPPAGGGAPPAGSPPPAGGGGSPPAGGGGQPPGAGAAPPPPGSAPYRPEGLPDHLVGANDRETLDKVFKAFDGFRRGEAERGALPKDPAGYQFTASDKLKPYTGDFDKDPVFGKAREFAHKAGLTDKQFNGFLVPMLESFIDGGLVDKPIDAQAQLMSLAPPGEYADDAAKKTAASKRMADNTAWIDGAKGQNSFGGNSAPIAEFLAAAGASDPRAHQLIEWLRGVDAPVQPAMGGQAAAANASQEAVKARMRDPRYDPNKPQFDRSFAEETDRLSRSTFG
jgi:hypothetical protein